MLDALRTCKVKIYWGFFCQGSFLKNYSFTNFGLIIILGLQLNKRGINDNLKILLKLA